jgi:NADPH:quinone reductase-like Zn-dependent oxidoreductase
MKAVVFDSCGSADVLSLADVPTPTPRAHEVRIKVHAATVSAEDPKMRAFDHPALFWLPVALLFGFPKPRVRILGMERILGGASNFHWTTADLEELSQLLRTGRLRTVVDREYRLEDAALAHRYVEQGHKRGNVVLNIVSREATSGVGQRFGCI